MTNLELAKLYIAEQCAAGVYAQGDVIAGNIEDFGKWLDERAAHEPKAAQRCTFVGMYDVQCGLDAGHEGEHRIFGPHQNRNGDG
jgi:hypothetical protein